MCYEYDPKYPDTTTTVNNEGNPGANDSYGYDEHDNDDDDWHQWKQWEHLSFEIEKCVLKEQEINPALFTIDYFFL